ncbi:MAG: nucleotidyltransferase domain-containing protein [Actinomycetota bacterium]|nr:nucleotidyltransferase domain-containing protein [Actinomycetota bacterium]
MTARLVRSLLNGRALYNGRTLADWVPDVVQELVDRFDPLRVILFGSVARGDDGPDSDIDLVVVLPPTTRSARSRMMGDLIAAASLGPPVDVFPTDPEEFAEATQLPGLLRVAAREGKVVYEREP